jgi:hypothetical protein
MLSYQSFFFHIFSSRHDFGLGVLRAFLVAYSPTCGLGEVMPPRIGLALVLCFVFPCLVLGVDILMAPYGDGSLFFCKFRPSQFRYC